MPDHETRPDSQLHPKEQYDEVAKPEVARDASARSAEDAGTTPSAAQGAVETEMTPLTPPSADTDSPAAQASTTDDDLDPAAEITPG